MTFTESVPKSPLLADVKPFGRYVMSDVDRVGGVPVILRALLDAGLIHGDCLTVTGKTMAENLRDINPPDPDGDILYASQNAIATSGGITILGGSLAPEGAVVKMAGVPVTTFEGKARVFDREQSAMEALEEGNIKAGDVVVIRYEGPKGGPGHAGNAHDHGCNQGCRTWQGGAFDHRRAILGGNHRIVRWGTSHQRQLTVVQSHSSLRGIESQLTSLLGCWICM